MKRSEKYPVRNVPVAALMVAITALTKSTKPNVPFSWIAWKNNSMEYPGLRKFVRDYLALFVTLPVAFAVH